MTTWLKELQRFLPSGPFTHVVGISRGPGDATPPRPGVPGTAPASVGALVGGVRSRSPGLCLRMVEAGELAEEHVRGVDLVLWPEGLERLPPEEGAAALRRIGGAVAHGLPAVIVAAPIAGPDLGEGRARRRGFERPDHFLEFVRRGLPSARGVPLQIELDRRPAVPLSSGQRAARLALRVVQRLAGARRVLRLAQRASTLPFLAPFVSPFVAHMAAVVDPARPPFRDMGDGLADHILHRPAAARIVQWLAPTSVTPNQVTLVSGVLGVGAAVVMSGGHWADLAVAGLLLELSVIADCVDGQLARAKGVTSRWGDALDHTSDDLAFVLVSAVMAVAIWRAELSGTLSALLTVGSAGAAVGLAVGQYFYVEEFRWMLAEGRLGKLRADAARAREEAGRGAGEWWGLFSGLLFRYYALRLRLMERGLTSVNPWRNRLRDLRAADISARRIYWELQALPLCLWRAAGIGNLAFLLALSCVLGRPMAFVWLVASLGPPYFLGVHWIQRRTDRLTLERWTR